MCGTSGSWEVSSGEGGGDRLGGRMRQKGGWRGREGEGGGVVEFVTTPIAKTSFQCCFRPFFLLFSLFPIYS